MHKIIEGEATIIVESKNPYRTKEVRHLKYQR